MGNTLDIMTTKADGGATVPEFTIMMVCLGNICRSPMAAAVLRAKLTAAGHSQVRVDSSGTGHWHVGEPADARARETLRATGYDDAHTARQLQPQDVADYDLVLVMDEANLRDVMALAPGAGNVRKFRSFDPEVSSPGAATDDSSDVPDPYYGGAAGFANVLAMVERTSNAIVEALEEGTIGS